MSEESTKPQTRELGDMLIPIACYERNGEKKTQSKKVGVIMASGDRVWGTLDPVLLNQVLVSEYKMTMMEFKGTRPKAGEVVFSCVKRNGKVATAPAKKEEFDEIDGDDIPF